LIWHKFYYILIFPNQLLIYRSHRNLLVLKGQLLLVEVIKVRMQKSHLG
jgi:hypothetical protein